MADEADDRHGDDADEARIERLQAAVDEPATLDAIREELRRRRASREPEVGPG